MRLLDLATLKFDYIGPSVERQRGYAREEAMTLSLEATLSRASLAEVSQILADELARDGQPGVDPQRARTIKIQESHKDGTYGWAEATVSFVRNEDGQPTAIIASGYSESERVREMQRMGAGHYIKKPYTLEKIGVAVRRELDRGVEFDG